MAGLFVFVSLIRSCVYFQSKTVTLFVARDYFDHFDALYVAMSSTLVNSDTKFGHSYEQLRLKSL